MITPRQQRTSRNITLAAVALVAISACSAESRYQWELDSHVTLSGLPGGQIAVQEPSGHRWVGAAGDAVKGETPMTEDHAQLIGSNTKMFTAAVVLQLVDAGELGLDDSAAQWVPQLDDRVTVRSLLQHTSGIGEYFDDKVFEDQAGYAAVWTQEELIALGQELPTGKPGDAPMHYSNSNYQALGLIIEAITGLSYADALQERIFDPLKMEHSGLIEPGSSIPGYLAPGDAGAFDGISQWNSSLGWAAGSAYATPEDMLRFMDALFGAQVYSERLLHEAMSGVRWEMDAGPFNLYYGLGLIECRGEGGMSYVGHAGGLSGYGSLMLWDSATGAITIGMFNQTGADSITPTMNIMKIAAEQP